MEPEDIYKGRIFTWSVLVTEFALGLAIMIFLARVEPGSLSTAELEAMNPEVQAMMRSEWQSALTATSNANVAGPIYFVLITGLSLAVLGGNWTLRIVYGVVLVVLAGITAAAPWLSPHSAVLKAETLPIVVSLVIAAIHLAGGAIILFYRPVKLFLHPRRMLFAPPQT